MSPDDLKPHALMTDAHLSLHLRRFARDQIGGSGFPELHHGLAPIDLLLIQYFPGIVDCHNSALLQGEYIALLGDF